MFLYNNGRMRLNINTAITQEDQEAFRGKQSNYFPIKEVDFKNLKKNYEILSKRNILLLSKGLKELLSRQRQQVIWVIIFSVPISVAK